MSWHSSASLETLCFRSRLLQTIRRFFDELGFLEVQTPVLSRDTVVDRHLDPIQVASESLGDVPNYHQSWYLQTSPEFQMKRLVASGLKAIYQIGPAFRAGEAGQLHNPEFTMLEWYRAGDDYAAGVQLLSDLTNFVFEQMLGEEHHVHHTSYQSAWLEHVGIDPLNSSVRELAEWASTQPSLGVAADWSQDKDDWLHLIFDAAVQPQLGKEMPCVLTDYPVSQSALARVSCLDPRVAERFELFIHGVELANGYHELLDASDLELRNANVNQQRIEDGKPELPVHSHLIEAMQAGLPACSGCALGLDRLLMVLLNLETVQEVLPFPWENA